MVKRGRFFLPQEPIPMMDAVRFCLMEKSVLETIHSLLKPSPLRELVAAALRYHTNELWQPIMQTPLTQPRSKCRCILGFGGMQSSGALVVNDDRFQAFQPCWDAWHSLGGNSAHRMSNMGIAVLNNFVYLVGGDNNSSRFRAESRCWR